MNSLEEYIEILLFSIRDARLLSYVFIADVFVISMSEIFNIMVCKRLVSWEEEVLSAPVFLSRGSSKSLFKCDVRVNFVCILFDL